MFSFDWETVNGETVTAVVGSVAQLSSTGTTVAGEVAIVVGRRYVAITVDADTDELRLAMIEGAAPNNWRPIEALADLVGRPLGWAWEGRNHRGYADAFLVSLSGWAVDDPRHDLTSPLAPDVMFSGCASSVRFSRLRSV